MAGLDSRFIVAPSLEMFFINKSTGLPLNGGKVYFWRDQGERNIPKSVYKITGTPPNYTYVELPNPVTLSSVGTFQDDSNNNVLPYFFPYEGTPLNTTGDLELYFIEVYAVTGGGEVLQFTREGWPNLTSDQSTLDDDVFNYVPNGQFLIHNNIPASEANGQIAGKISQDSTEIAPGGWSFDRSSGSTGTYLVTFPRYDAASADPTGNPRYALQLQIQIPDLTDTHRDIRLKFKNVNRFSSGAAEPISYNFYFEASSEDLLDIPGFQLFVIRNFGTGGSATTEEFINTFTITPDNQPFQTSITFDEQTMQTIGDDDDDYLQLVIRAPNTAFTAKFTDFALTIDGERHLTVFPEETNAEQIAKSTAGWLPTPNPDGSDLYLHVWQTRTGYDFDRGQIGTVYEYTAETAPDGYLLCDGATYKYFEYSSIGIPYYRLGDKWWNDSIKCYIFGTGSAYFTAVYPTSTGVTDKFRIVQNTLGLASAAANGTPSPGFTFASVHVGSNYYATSFLVSSTEFYIRSTEVGFAADTITAGTSGFTVAKIEPSSLALDTQVIKDLYSVTPVAATGLAGLYFTFHTRNGGVQQSWYVWFKVDTVGADPAPGGTGIEIDLLSTDAISDVAQKISEALNGFQIVEIQVGAASTIDGGDYFAVFTPGSVEYRVWYEKDGTGTAPATSNAIKVQIIAADTAAQVASKTWEAINKYSYAVPNLKGLFIRGWDDGAGVDPEADSRYSFVPNYMGDNIGTLQLDAIHQHFHPNVDTEGTNAAMAGTDFNAAVHNDNYPTHDAGTYESRPVNISMNRIVKY